LQTQFDELYAEYLAKIQELEEKDIFEFTPNLPSDEYLEKYLSATLEINNELSALPPKKTDSYNVYEYEYTIKLPMLSSQNYITLNSLSGGDHTIWPLP
jgi:hypothetical protein